MTATDPVSDHVERLINEGPIGITAAAKLIGTFRDGRPTATSTITRWAMKGIDLPDGRKLKLETFRLNGRLMTSRAAVLRFIAAQQVDVATDPAAPTKKASVKDAQAATAELDARLGIRR